MLVCSQKATKVSIYDLAGTEVFNSALSQTNYNIDGLAKGIYIVKAQINGQTIKAKVYKKNKCRNRIYNYEKLLTILFTFSVLLLSAQPQAMLKNEKIKTRRIKFQQAPEWYIS